MKTKQKIIVSCLLSALFIVASVFLFLQLFAQKDNVKTKGVYNGAFTAFADGAAANAIIGETKGMMSTDGEYYLLATSFDVDNVANYKELGYEVTVGDAAEAEKVGASNLYYTGIVVKTSETTTKEWILGENIFTDVAADGMIVAEMEYDLACEYIFMPYLLTNDDTKITLDTPLSIKHTHELALDLISEPTSKKIASYGTLDTTGMQINAVCSSCQETITENVTAVQSAYEHGAVVTFTYEDASVSVPVEEVTGYEVKVQKFTGYEQYTNYQTTMNALPKDWATPSADGYPTDAFKTSGYVGASKTRLNENNKEVFNTLTIVNDYEKNRYLGEYNSADLWYVGGLDAVGEKVTYYVYSEVSGNANISVLASSNTAMAATVVPSLNFNEYLTVTVNGTSATVSASASTKEFTSTATYQMYFTKVLMTTVELQVGWNELTITRTAAAAIQLSDMFFDFVQA